MKRRLGLGAVVAVACAGRVLAAEASIELQPQPRVASGAVLLGQVAHVRGTDLPLVRALVLLPIGRAPAAGQRAVLDRETLAGWIRQRLPMAATLVWSGASETVVAVESRTVRGEEIAAAAEKSLHPWLAARSERTEVRVAWMPPAVEVPEGTLRLRPRPLGNAAVRSRMVVWVDLWSGERFVRSLPVSFAVRAWRDLPTATQPLAVGAPIATARLALHPVDLAALDGASLASPPAQEAQRGRRAVRAGEPVLARDVAAVPEVQRGAWASLRSGAGAVTSEARVEVLQDGRVGDTVRVRQQGAMAQVTARVVGPGRLEITR